MKKVSGEILLFVPILMVAGEWLDHVIHTTAEGMFHVVGRELPAIGVHPVV